LRTHTRRETKKSLRGRATPLIIGSFLIMGVSGIVMFVHVETTMAKVIHEWAGWVMVAGAVAHLVLNWRAFTSYFKRPLATGIMAASAVLLALSFLPGGPAQSTGDITRTAIAALSGGQIGTLAEFAGSDTETALAELGAAGFEVHSDDTPARRSGGDRMAQVVIITTIFTRQPPIPRPRQGRDPSWSSADLATPPAKPRPMSAPQGVEAVTRNRDGAPWARRIV